MGQLVEVDSMDIDGYKVPDNLLYHKEHMWARVEGDLVVIGGTDFMVKLAGAVKRVVTLEEDDEVEAGKAFGTISTGKWTGKLYSPVSGEIAEVNEDVDANPKIINDDPYGKGWLIKVKPSNLQGDIAGLMKANDGAFEPWFKAEIAKHAKK
jgi:glycine cleavage system H protein